LYPNRLKNILPAKIEISPGAFRKENREGKLKRRDRVHVPDAQPGECQKRRQIISGGSPGENKCGEIVERLVWVPGVPVEA
jgi:hypothetical protein